MIRELSDLDTGYDRSYVHICEYTINSVVPKINEKFAWDIPCLTYDNAFNLSTHEICIFHEIMGCIFLNLRNKYAKRN